MPADAAARRLLGCELTREYNGQTLRAKIVETEAYDQTDPASHSFRGPTARTKAMFGPAGHAYIYFTYGMHYCFNIVCGADGYGSGVLIRAAEPLTGLEAMQQNRHGITDETITNGPAKLCYALAIDKVFYGHNLRKPPLTLTIEPALNPSEIIQTTRIGIKQATDVPWRFYIKDNPYVSKK